MGREHSLVLKLKKGDERAFKAVYELYADKIYHLGQRFYLDQEDAREVVQDVFLTLWKKKQQLNESLSLNAFLLTIAKHKIINLNKKKAVEMVRTQEYLMYTNTSASSAEDNIVFSDLEKVTQDFINSLAPRRKQIFTLSRGEGLSNEEIANHLKISRRTVENNIYQAEKDIKFFLKSNQLVARSLLFYMVWMSL